MIWSRPSARKPTGPARVAAPLPALGEGSPARSHGTPSMRRQAASWVAWPRPTIVLLSNSAAMRPAKSSGTNPCIVPRLSTNSRASWVSSECCPNANGPRKNCGGSALANTSSA